MTNPSPAAPYALGALPTDRVLTTIDERRTTVTADQAMIEGGLNGKQRRKVVDRVAAAILLQSWLNREHGR